jgi:hypothetical protein
MRNVFVLTSQAQLQMAVDKYSNYVHMRKQRDNHCHSTAWYTTQVKKIHISLHFPTLMLTEITFNFCSESGLDDKNKWKAHVKIKEFVLNFI